MQSKVEFGKALKSKVLKEVDRESIGKWAYIVYLDWLDVNDVDFLKLLLELSGMELGYQFYFTYEELQRIADDLIKGRDVKL